MQNNNYFKYIQNQKMDKLNNYKQTTKFAKQIKRFNNNVPRGTLKFFFKKIL